MAKRELSIELLNRAIAMEMTATHQYMYFHFRCEDYGYEPLAMLFKRIGIVEMRHIERLAERILFLGGDPKLLFDQQVQPIAEVGKMLEKSSQLELDTVNAYNEFAHRAAELSDHVTKKLFEELLVEEEAHEDQFDTEGDNFGQFPDHYLALQSIEHSKSIARHDTSVG